MTEAGWEGILDQGEKILWQGRPDGKLVWTGSNVLMAIFGLFFAGFAVVWMVLAASAGGFFWMFGLIHFGVGLGIGVGAVVFSAYKRRHSWYTLTSRRAFIATELPIRGKSLKSYPIDDDTVLEFIDQDPATIYFATERKRGKNSTYTVNIGFERIENGREVYGLFRQLQKAAI